ncbi:hypothetical protein EDD29_9003 [Actinocorallia herbida]|uniref:ABC-type transport system involved in multi-copper enzyme maturation permease subunit n=1 Tax=Actinocorallia herbida TaxID=58109 RepID=A0A3N1DCK9_9ACTN|nr:hypothetical protein [Actinocorallia herbida]ROO91250.1 hypothetical protein EDD29_9003 [Actinocorallia herbida]
MRGALLVARQELGASVRKGRWKALLAGWTLVVGLLATVLYRTFGAEVDGADLHAGVCGALVPLVLLLVLCAAPVFATRQVGGGRGSGSLPAPALGGLLTSWGTGLVLLAPTVPFLAVSVLTGAVGPFRALACLVVAGLLVGVVCALGRLCSTAGRRGVAALLSALTVGGLVFGTVLAYFLSFLLQPPAVPDEGEGGPWWLLAANPLIVLADAAPLDSSRIVCARVEPNVEHCEREGGGDLLSQMSFLMRDLRAEDRSYESYGAYVDLDEGRGGPGLNPVWPYGLGIDLALAAGALTLTVRRLRRPVRAPRQNFSGPSGV